MIAYHVVTDHPMSVGQQIVFDENHHSGVYQRVQDKMEIVRQIYADPAAYQSKELEHHTAVALRELAMEEVRQKMFPHYPSRMACLYVSKTLEDAEKWGTFFVEIGRPTYSIVKLKIEGRCFCGDATKCFRGTPNLQMNLYLAERYWKNDLNTRNESAILEILVDGRITVLEICKEINAHLSPN